MSKDADRERERQAADFGRGAAQHPVALLKENGKEDQVVLAVGPSGLQILKLTGFKFTELVRAPWSRIESLDVDGADALQKRVTVTRLFMVGIFAFALQKRSGEVYIFFSHAGTGYLLRVPKKAAPEVRSWFRPYEGRINSPGNTAEGTTAAGPAVVGSASPGISAADRSSAWSSLGKVEIPAVPFAIAFSPEGSRAYVGGLRTPRVEVLDIPARSLRPGFTLSGDPSRLAITADGRLLVATVSPNRLEVIDLESGSARAGLNLPSMGHQLHLTSTGKAVVATNAPGTVLVVDVATCVIESQWDIGSKRIGEIAIDEPGNRILIAATKPDRIVSLDAASGHVREQVMAGKGVENIRLGGDGQLLVGCTGGPLGGGASVQLWSRDLKKAQELPVQSGVFKLAMNDARGLVALAPVAMGPKKIMALGAATLSPISEYDIGDRMVTSLAFSPDGATLLAGYMDGLKLELIATSSSLSAPVSNDDSDMPDKVCLK